MNIIGHFVCLRKNVLAIVPDLCHIKRLFTEVEVASGEYLPSREKVLVYTETVIIQQMTIFISFIPVNDNNFRAQMLTCYPMFQ